MTDTLIRIRQGSNKDAIALAETHEEAWRNAYQGMIPHLALERMIARRGPGWWQGAIARKAPLVVLDFGGAAAGYATFGRRRGGRLPFEGEIFELYVRPTYQGLGFGRLLFEAARKRLDRAGLRGTSVWALADNDGACAFYLRMGGRAVAESDEQFGDVTLKKIAFAWR
jgi:ribosomal protein S18 acetylase RimI-like enzyme